MMMVISQHIILIMILATLTPTQYLINCLLFSPQLHLMVPHLTSQKLPLTTSDNPTQLRRLSFRQQTDDEFIPVVRLLEQKNLVDNTGDGGNRKRTPSSSSSSKARFFGQPTISINILSNLQIGDIVRAFRDPAPVARKTSIRNNDSRVRNVARRRQPLNFGFRRRPSIESSQFNLRRD